ncbi:MAG: hypothetical protein PHU29_08350 [Sulfuricurvum sp.]|uniref:hypothetical protein n=1 Tax=Sulfuricurvum sp. TaxID=2025608 RepID=UPI0026029C68|nr:hypothetical protein [Sulfuricurvum sp.]MDD2950784.1 hypothetical protein [Sulfuricurvum sp.]MDD5118565.1 hypothetical protein [Sulfuricurvum sp.]
MKKIIVVLLLIAVSLWGAPYKEGQSVPPLELKDQFGTKHILKVMPHTLIMVFEKGTSSTVNDYLAAQDKGYLNAHNAAFVADISGMPSFITKAFAIPKMQKYPHIVLLIDDEEFGLKFPGKEEKITIMKFKGNTVESIDYVGTADELKKAIEQ